MDAIGVFLFIEGDILFCFATVEFLTFLILNIADNIPIIW
jgi:hypothetical protein